MRWQVLAGLVVIALPALALAASDEWEFQKESDGVRVFTRDSRLPAVKSVRAETVIPVDDPYVILAVLADMEAAVELVDRMKFVEEIESSEPGKSLTHMVMDLPWPVQDRDATASVTISSDEEAQHIVMRLIGDPTLIPVDPKYIRMPDFESSYTLRYGQGEGVHVTFESMANLGGSVPAWVMNYGNTEMPVKTLTNMRRMSAREKYHGQKQRLLKMWNDPD